VQTIIITLLFFLPQDIATYPVVNEVFYDTPGTDSDEEWVEIYNPTGSSINISNYKVGDADSNTCTEGGMYKFPDGSYFSSDAYITICQHDTTFERMYGFHCDFEFKDSDGSSANDMEKYSSWGTGTFALSNSGDNVLLLDSFDNPIDVVCYEGGSYTGVIPHGGVSTGHSIERAPPGEDTDDCSVDMVDRASPNPQVGGAVRGPVISSVFRGPYCPVANEKDTIYSVITDDTGLQSETVWYSINGGSYTDVSMTPANGDTFWGVIPGQTDEKHIRYFIVAIDIDAIADTSETKGYFSGLTAIDSLRPNDDVSGIPLYVGHAIRVTGLITVNSHTFETTSHIINLQNNRVGVVAKSTNSEMADVSIGDSVTACGTISYWMGQTRITSPNDEPFIVEEPNKREPDIYILQYTDFYDYVGDTMDYEGLLVGLVNAGKYKGNWGNPDESFSIWLQEYGAPSPPDTVEMWIDSDTDIDDNPEPEWPKNVVGVYSQYDNSSPYWSGYEIMPRSYADFDYELPIYLTGFYATEDLGKVYLTWQASCEKNAYVYEIRREEGVCNGCDRSEIIGEVTAYGNSNSPQNYHFYDEDVNPGNTYFYWLIGITTSGRRTIYGPVSVKTGNSVFDVSLVSKNPFRNQIKIEFISSVPVPTNIKVYDITGRLVKTLVSDKIYKGKQTIKWNGLDKYNKTAGEGVYFIQVNAGDRTVTKKVVLIK
jgi:hypothetical protein